VTGCIISAMRRSWVATVLLMTLVVCGLTAPARAHVLDRAASVVQPVAGAETSDSRPTAPAPVDSIAKAVPASPTVPLILLLPILVASLILAYPSRRILVGLLIPLLAVFALEAGVHSVHHLGDQDAAARCIVAAASLNLSGTVAAPVTLVAPAATDDPAPPVDPERLPQRLALPDQGRAPPFLG
jgi:hypothetical protein